MKRTTFFGMSVIIACIGVAVFTPDRLGGRIWSIAKIPIVLILIAMWMGFVISLITQKKAGTRELGPNPSKVDLSAAAKSSDTLIASARLRAKLTILALFLACAAFAVWDALVRLPPEWVPAVIWAGTSVALGFHLSNLIRQRVIFAPSTISWSGRGHTVSKAYRDVTDFRVLSGSELQVVFSDGQKISITSEMADLQKVLATISARRLTS